MLFWASRNRNESSNHPTHPKKSCKTTCKTKKNHLWFYVVFFPRKSQQKGQEILPTWEVWRWRAVRWLWWLPNSTSPTVPPWAMVVDSILTSPWNKRWVRSIFGSLTWKGFHFLEGENFKTGTRCDYIIKNEWHSSLETKKAAGPLTIKYF